MSRLVSRSSAVTTSFGLSLFVLATLFLSSASAFYVAFNPTAYKLNDDVILQYNKIFSEKTQLPFAYNDLPFVCSVPNPESRLLNLGEVLRGDRLAVSNFKIKFLEQNTKDPCKILCTVRPDANAINQLREVIDARYKVEWLVDDLPGATSFIEKEANKKSYEAGFPIGEVQDGKYIVNNHFTFNILYEHNPARKEYYIIGFEVFPKSVKNEADKCDASFLTSKTAPPMEVRKDTDHITYTYSIVWTEEKKLHWFNRWDLYLTASDSQIHWYSIINSLIILLFLSAMVAIIMLRTINGEISAYAEEEMKEEGEETYGWKLLHGDVFRPPRLFGLLSALVGSGIQFILTIVSITLFAMVGILNPSYRGGLVHVSLFIYVFTGAFGGYFGTRIFKAFKGNSWAKNAFLTIVFCPGLILFTLFILNFFVWGRGSSNAIPFGTFFALVAMWFGICAPLVFIGAFMGWKRNVIEHPVRTNQIPRQIPDRITWYLRPWASVMITGMIPFAVGFLELFFILNSVWRANNYYYLFGFLGVSLLLIFIACIQVTIITIYFQLSAEDYRWHWRSFMISSASSFYIFGYFVLYFVKFLDITEFTSVVLFFTHSFIGCFIYWLCTGTVGFLSTYFFLIKIYGAVKID